jgi:hypothetical protein
MENYNKVCNVLQSNDCKIITTFDEFENYRETNKHGKYYGYVRVDYVATCGHNANVAVTNFLTRKTGLKCKDCVKKNSSTIQKSKNHIETSIIENDGIKLIEPLIATQYNFMRTKEGCLADIIVKRKSQLDDLDKWLNIQIKVTKEPIHNMYTFRSFKKSYEHMLLICICINESKIWVIPYNDLNIKDNGSLNISSRSKYNKYLAKDGELINEIEKYYDTCKQTTNKEANTPISILQQREQEYIAKRELAIPYLKYDYLQLQNTPTDFIINNKKVQEKVMGPIKTGIVAFIASNNGKNDKGKRSFRTYRYDENDYYWLHSSIDTRFWIIPQDILLERKYISTTDETLKQTRLYIGATYKNMEWIKKYEYDYTKINVDKIKDLFA